MERKVTIHEIEKWNEGKFRELYDGEYEVVLVKGFRCYLCDIGGNPKYSMIVFAPNGNQVHYANEYELHYNKKTHEQLREIFLKSARNSLFTEAELEQPLKSYFDYKARYRFITEYLPFCARYGYFSCYWVYSTEKQKQEHLEEQAKWPVFCPPARAYFKKDDEAFADHIGELFIRLCQQKNDTADDYQYNYDMFYYELGNHEFHLSLDPDWSVLCDFGRIRRDPDATLDDYFDDLGFTETQRKAYRDAVRQYIRDCIKQDRY